MHRGKVVGCMLVIGTRGKWLKISKKWFISIGLFANQGSMVSTILFTLFCNLIMLADYLLAQLLDSVEYRKKIAISFTEVDETFENAGRLIVEKFNNATGRYFWLILSDYFFEWGILTRIIVYLWVIIRRSIYRYLYWRDTVFRMILKNRSWLRNDMIQRWFHNQLSESSKRHVVNIFGDVHILRNASKEGRSVDVCWLFPISNCYAR